MQPSIITWLLRLSIPILISLVLLLLNDHMVQIPRTNTLLSKLNLPFLKTKTAFFTPSVPSTMPRGAVVSISHGGGPMPVLGDPGHADLVRSLREKVPKILKLNTPEAPRAIVVVTAHWSTKHPTVSSGATHPLLYDYGGFPPESYELKYPAPGSPEVAREVKAALDAVGFETKQDAERGAFSCGHFFTWTVRKKCDLSERITNEENQVGTTASSSPCF